MNKRDTVEEVLEAFRIFDKDGQGFITLQEFRHILGSMAEKFTEEELEETCKELDDGSGTLAYEEFVKIALA
jgi:calmodulin